MRTAGTAATFLPPLVWMILVLTGCPTGLPPGVPTDLVVSGPTAGSLDVRWGIVPGADAYVVRRDTTSDGAFATVVHEAPTASLTDNGLNANTTYWYRVLARNAAGDSDLSGAVSGTTLAGGETRGSLRRSRSRTLLFPRSM